MRGISKTIDGEKVLDNVSFIVRRGDKIAFISDNALAMTCLLYTSTTSGVSMEYFDQAANEKYIPYVIEPSLGADRVALAFLCDAYDEEVVGQDKNGKDDVRTVLRLHPALAPFKAAVLPLSKKLTDKAMPIWQELAKQFSVDFDDAGSIGKRYRREDEIGTPYCVTVDFETEQDGCVTVRDRDTMEQERIKIEEVAAYIAKKIEF